MNRFEYTSPLLLPNEYYLVRDRNVRLYDGDQKVSFLNIVPSLKIHLLFIIDKF